MRWFAFLICFYMGNNESVYGKAASVVVYLVLGDSGHCMNTNGCSVSAAAERGFIALLQGNGHRGGDAFPETTSSACAHPLARFRARDLHLASAFPECHAS